MGGQVYQVFAKVDFTNRVAIRTAFGTGYSALGYVTREPLIYLRFHFRSRFSRQESSNAHLVSFDSLTRCRLPLPIRRNFPRPRFWMVSGFAGNPGVRSAAI